MTSRDLLTSGIVVGGRYKVVRTLGAGGMGAVYEATDIRLGHKVALKLLTNSDERAPAAFEREARILASLRHPALPHVSDHFVEDRGQFLIMDFIDGEDLNQARNRRNEPFDFADVFGWAITLLDVLSYLHLQDPPVVHRDIKPANIKLTPQGNLVLLDFGLAKGSSADVAPEMMRSMYAYTVQYAPPEQIDNRGTEPRSDLYAFAATIYCLLVGQPPVDSSQRRLMIAERHADPLQPLHTRNPHVPESFSTVLMQALALDIRDRPASAAVVRDLLIGGVAANQTTVAALSLVSPDSTTQAATDERPADIQMPARRAIWYDTTERRNAFLQLLDGFAENLSSERLRNVLGRETMAQIRARVQQIRSRLETPFTLVVMGDFKRGKSTLVNALLGRDLVPSNITPETVTINRITYGPELNIVAHLANGARVQLSPEELRADHLEPLMRQLPHPILYVTIEAPVPWLNGIMLVDVPGTGDLDWRYDAQVQAYLPQADAIIYVISALAPLAASEQAFLKRAVAPQEFPKLCFVVNMIDAIRNQADVARIIDLIHSRVDQVFPGASIFGMSALDELARQTGRSRPNRRRTDELAACFATFRHDLDESVLLNRDLIRIERAIAQTHALLNGVEESARRLRTAVEHDHAQLQAAIAQCVDNNSNLRQSLDQHRAQARRTISDLGIQTVHWMDRFINRIQSEVLVPLTQYRYADVQKHLTFFLSDSLSVALNTCIEAHQSELAAILDHTRSAASTLMTQTTGVHNSPPTGQIVARLTFNQATWSDFDTIHLVALQAQQYIFGSVGQLALAGIFAIVEKKVDDPSQLNAYQDRLRQTIPELRNNLQREITALYARLADEIDHQIDQSYQDDLAASLSTLRQAEQIQQTGGQQVQDMHRICDLIISETQMSGSQLHTFQRDLWPDDFNL